MTLTIVKLPVIQNKAVSMKAIPLLFVIGVSLMLAGCSNSYQHFPKYKDQLSTQINIYGMKLFKFRVTLKSTTKYHQPYVSSTMQRNAVNGNRVSPAGDTEVISEVVIDDETLTTIIHQRLAFRLKKSGYCKDGYYTLSEFIAIDKSVVRGECRDGASDKDKALFPNKAPL